MSRDRLTLRVPSVRKGQPEREDDGEQSKVGELLLQAGAGEGHVKRLGLDFAFVAAAAGRAGGGGGGLARCGDTYLFLISTNVR